MPSRNKNTVKLEYKYSLLTSNDGSSIPDTLHANFNSEESAIEYAENEFKTTEDNAEREFYIVKILKVISSRPIKPPITIKTVL